MGAKAKKALKKSLKKASSSKTSNKKQNIDFLSLEDRSISTIREDTEPETKSAVLYIGRIPHGFYEKEMEAYFSQFGKIKRMRIARNKKTGNSKHFGFMEFEDPEVAEVVADCMNNYLLFEHLLQVQVIPQERVHPNLWKGFNYRFKPLDWVQIERERQNKERTLEGYKKSVEKIVKRDQKRRKRIEAAGLDYECPEIVGNIQPTPKRIKFSDD